MTTIVLEPAAESKPEASSLSRMTREGLRNLLKVQNILLDFAAEQNAIAFKVVRDRIKSEEATPANALVDSVEEILEGIVSMQRSIVDFGTERLDREPAAKDEVAPVKE